ncbi:GFA family protein [Pelagovum pacificum]|uniref:GFA family protein n=1 Tax=Pelagovum pacificum TaxID=2588711 RepID=A0A5C5GD80_9RHOB|nr:GFA family protein [Pelagovum pacificum]QQA44172.1 GFA family protein [Pelagovum pacificum]TNY32703.1 GFA family protein [Pelagovum pacificum]
MTEAPYTGSCQCGGIRYEVDVDINQSVTCNCSRCQRLGSVLAFTSRDKFTLLTPEADTTEYLFNERRISHRFCPVCGIEPFAYGEMPDGAKMAAVNVNCLEGVDPRALTPHHVDGASS